jgi:hypothetical protein
MEFFIEVFQLGFFIGIVQGGNLMAHIPLRIEHLGDKEGWRVVQSNGNFRPNPSVKKKVDTISWQSPPEYRTYIVAIKESPFARKDGSRVVDEVIEIPAGKKSESFIIADVGDGLHEYAALIETGEKDYTYVRGADSPPGVIIGGP